MSTGDRRILHKNSLFQVEKEEVAPGKQYYFTRRKGAVFVLPVLFGQDGEHHILSIQNKRAYYGTSIGLPSGNREGSFDNPEPVVGTAMRELAEETGYGYPRGYEGKPEVLRFKSISTTILYPRHIVVMRGVEPVIEPEDNPREVVTLRPVKVDAFLDLLLSQKDVGLPAEVPLAFTKAASELGTAAVRNWITEGDAGTHEEVVRSFEPWLTYEDPNSFV